LERRWISKNVRSKLHVAFEIGVVLKGLNGLIELIGGILLLIFPPSAIRQFIINLSHKPELVRHLSSGDKRFAAIYLLSHGIVKGVLVYGLLREQLWAFPWAIAIFIGFGIYQIARYISEPSVWLIILTVLDVFVIVLTWFEWQRVRGSGRQPSRPA
jgi:uncharacterized membrane protein